MAEMKPVPGFGTEYSDNYQWDSNRANASSWTKESSGLFGKESSGAMGTHMPPPPTQMGPEMGGSAMGGAPLTRTYIDIHEGQNSQGHPHRATQAPGGTGAPMAGETALMEATGQKNPAAFRSQKYPSVYRETVVRKDDRGKYIDPLGPPMKYLADKPYGRRLIYDDTHPDKMYASQWSSELADPCGPYSFPTTTGLPQEIPWKKDLQWQAEGEVGNWPTDLWKTWEAVAECPTYDGHDDQVEYSKYKVQVP